MFQRRGGLEHFMEFLYFARSEKKSVWGRLERHGPKQKIDDGISPTNLCSIINVPYTKYNTISDIAEECGYIYVEQYYIGDSGKTRDILKYKGDAEELMGYYGSILHLFGFEKLPFGLADDLKSPPLAEPIFIKISNRRSKMEMCLDILSTIKIYEAKIPENCKTNICHRNSIRYNTFVDMLSYMADEHRRLLSTYSDGNRKRYRLEKKGEDVLKCLGSIVDILGMDRLSRLYK